MRESLVIAALNFVVVLGGYQYGIRGLAPGSPPNYLTAAAAVAGVLFGVGYYRAKTMPRWTSTDCSKVCGVSFLYSAALVLLDPIFLLAWYDTSALLVVTSSLLPVPLLFSTGVLVRHREYFSVAAVLLFVFCCYAQLAGNLANDRWRGFLLG
jgi:hypothetical protein